MNNPLTPFFVNLPSKAVRKTIDTWELHVDYGQGYEHELTEESRQEANTRLKEYRVNCPQYPAKIIKRRERKPV